MAVDEDIDVAVVDPGGRRGVIKQSQLPAALARGFTLESQADTEQRQAAARNAGADNAVSAFMYGVAAGATGGILTPQSTAGKARARELREQRPGWTMAGEVAGLLIPGSPAAKVAGSAGKAVSGFGKGYGLMGRAAESAVRGATEGGVYGTYSAVPGVMLSDEPLSGERIVADLGSGALHGAMIGAPLGMAGEAVAGAYRAVRGKGAAAVAEMSEPIGAGVVKEAEAAGITPRPVEAPVPVEPTSSRPATKANVKPPTNAEVIAEKRAAAAPEAVDKDLTAIDFAPPGTAMPEKTIKWAGAKPVGVKDLERAEDRYVAGGVREGKGEATAKGPAAKLDFQYTKRLTSGEKATEAESAMAAQEGRTARIPKERPAEAPASPLGISENGTYTVPLRDIEPYLEFTNVKPEKLNYFRKLRAEGKFKPDLKEWSKPRVELVDGKFRVLDGNNRLKVALESGDEAVDIKVQIPGSDADIGTRRVLGSPGTVRADGEALFAGRPPITPRMADELMVARTDIADVHHVAKSLKHQVETHIKDPVERTAVLQRLDDGIADFEAALPGERYQGLSKRDMKRLGITEDMLNAEVIDLTPSALKPRMGKVRTRQNWHLNADDPEFLDMIVNQPERIGAANRLRDINNEIRAMLPSGAGPSTVFPVLDKGNLTGRFESFKAPAVEPAAASFEQASARGAAAEAKVAGTSTKPRPVASASKGELDAQMRRAVEKELGVDLGKVTPGGEVKLKQETPTKAKQPFGRKVAGWFGGGLAGHFGWVAGGPVGGMAGYQVGKMGAQALYDSLAGNAAGKLGAASANVQQRIANGLDRVIKAGPAVKRVAIPASVGALNTASFGDSDKTKAKTAMDAFRQRQAELARIAADPMAERRRVHELLSGVRALAPKAADAAEATAMRRTAFLLAKMPRNPGMARMGIPLDNWKPSDGQLVEWSRYVAAAEDPVGRTMAEMEAGSLTPQTVEAVRVIYPELYADMKRSFIERVVNGEVKSWPRGLRTQISIFFGVPSSTFDAPENVQALQQNFATEEGSDSGTRAPTARLGSAKNAEGSTPAQRLASGE